MTRTPPTETIFEEMKRYVRFSREDAEHLLAFKPRAAPHFASITDEFYERIREHELAHDVLKDEAQVQRLKKSLVLWMERALTGPHDEVYFAETSKIGRAHVRVGLPQRYMLTAMALISDAFDAIADATMGEDALRTRHALGRLLALELAIMLETYRDAYVERIQQAERGERERVDRTLARTEHRYINAVELARVMIVGIDDKGAIRLFNREAERVTGLARDEALGAPFVETLVPEVLWPEHGPILREAIAGTAVRADVLKSEVRTRTGKIRDVNWQLAHAPSEEGDDVVCFAIGQDITDQNALAARVRQSEKLAAVGTLAAGLAHEIRNPLNGAQLHVTFLERGLRRSGIDDPDTQEAVKVVGEEIKRLSNLVSEFLDFARPQPLTKRLTSLLSLAERTGQLVAADAERGSVVVKLDLPPNDLEIELDPEKMEQVILNVLRNAIESVAVTGGGTATLRLRRQPRVVLLEIEDDGPGLASPEAPIFDPFFSTKPNGTGLGLAIAHRIVSDHEGTIDVSSRPGRTIFRISLPIRP